MKHPLSDARIRELAGYRAASRVFGSAAIGRMTNLFSRAGLLSPDLKTYYVLNVDPLVIYIGNVMRHTFDIAELLKHRRVHFVKNFYSTFEDPKSIGQLKLEFEQFRYFYPQHTISFVCATEEESRMFSEAGLTPCCFVNKNALIDERQYVIQSGVRKEFDAIYNGQLALYKRHELAASIRSLALIVYRHGHVGRTVENDLYGERIRGLLQHATWLNDVDRLIPPGKIYSYLNRARVGLCLSAAEGPMAACMEYFLCGLPVVSTRSLGGRDVFFDDRYVKVVDDDAEAVAEGVRALVRSGIDPQAIRDLTLAKMQVHRDRFVEFVDDVLERAGAPRDFGSRFQSLFVNKMRAAGPFPGAFLVHASRGMPVELCRRFAAERNA